VPKFWLRRPPVTRDPLTSARRSLLVSTPIAITQISTTKPRYLCNVFSAELYRMLKSLFNEAQYIV